VELAIRTAGKFWRQGHGAVHYGFASADPGARARFAEQAATASAGVLWTETWTNSSALILDPRVELHEADTAVLLRRALVLAGARRETALPGNLLGPSSARPVVVIILDLAEGPGGQLADAMALLQIGRYTGISVTLILPSLGLELIDPRPRQMLCAAEAEVSGPGT